MQVQLYLLFPLRIDIKQTGFTVSQATKALRDNRGIVLLYFNLGTRRDEGSSSRPGRTPQKDPVPIVQEAGFAPRASLDRCGKPPPTGIRSPDL